MMKYIKLRSLLAVTFALLFWINRIDAKPIRHLNVTDDDCIVIMESAKVFLKIEKRGGQLIDIRLKSNPVNPLSWKLEKNDMPKYSHENAQYKGHFLCVGNIGKPSEADLDAGLVMRGEQTGKIWWVEIENDRKLVMGSSSPTDGLEISRTMEIHESESQILVVESFANSTSTRRPTNMFQHVTLGPPFLNPSTVINSNAKSGFHSRYQADRYKYELDFPYAILDSNRCEKTDVRQVSTGLNYVASYIFVNEDQYAWVTAYDPTTGVLLGYVWVAAQYPWLNFWNASKNDEPVAKGLEFGTTGIGGTFGKSLKDTVSYHGRYSWEHIDARDSIEKRYAIFIVDIGKNRNNPTLNFSQGSISIVGDDGIAYRTISNILSNLDD